MSPPSDLKQAAEARTIVGDEREKHPVRLSLRSGAVACVVVDHTHLIVHESGNVALPKRRPLLRRTAHFEERQQKQSRDCFQSHVTPFRSEASRRSENDRWRRARKTSRTPVPPKWCGRLRRGRSHALDCP